MSEVATRFDAREHIVGLFNMATYLYNTDLDFVPADSFTNSPGGAARPVSHLTADAGGLCMATAALISGNNMPNKTPEEREAFANSLDSAEKCKAFMNQASAAAIEAFKALPEENFNDIIMAPWGAEITKFGLATITASHIWYHDAQLNYIQALAGDGEVHWQM